MDEQITFERILKLSPELAGIKTLAQGWYQHPDRWRNYECLKSNMCKYVGMTARRGLPPFMYGITAYDVAYQAIFRDGQDFSEPEEEEEEDY